jgi:polysaccharide pyruvyl transferase WcaK-like protein
MQAPQRIRIGVLAHVGNGNLGDEATVAAMLRNLRERLPEAEFVAFTLNPADTARRHGVTSYPIRRDFFLEQTAPAAASSSASEKPRRERLKSWIRGAPFLMRPLRGARAMLHGLRQALLEIPFLCKSYRRLSSTSLLLIAGSHQLSEIRGGPWWFPFTLFKWTLLARVRRIPVALVSVGAGPFHSPLARWLSRFTLAMAAYASYRDEVSREAIRRLGVREPGPFAPDLAFSLSPAVHDSDPRQPIVALNPMPPFLWRDYDQATAQALHANYAGALTKFVTWLIDRGYRVAFLATQLRGDPPVIADLLKRVANERPDAVERGQAYVHRVEGLDDLLTGLRFARIVVATRFHGAVLGSAVGRPVLALAYHPKTYDLMRQMGDGRHAVDAEGISAEALKSAFVELEQQSPSAAAERQACLAATRTILAAQYDRLVELLHRRRVPGVDPLREQARVA